MWLTYRRFQTSDYGFACCALVGELQLNTSQASYLVSSRLQYYQPPPHVILTSRLSNLASVIHSN
jgi:hypothetical protein